jgi:protein-S-isoprenylcysteine O-methyltransferase Ste14
LKPLYLHDATARGLVIGALVIWGGLELYWRWRSRTSRGEPEWSFFAVLAGIALGILLGFRLEHVAATAIGGWAPVLLGTALMLAGTAFRAWAILVLGRFFTVTVTIQPDHRIVEEGPYRRLRHPSYTGLLLAMIGLGLALGNWLSLLALAVLPLVGVLLRIRAEESALSRALGDDYRAYAARTDRLIPGVW